MKAPFTRCDEWLLSFSLRPASAHFIYPELWHAPDDSHNKSMGHPKRRGWPLPTATARRK